MTQENKELLLRDLCVRFPYGLKGKCEIDASYDTSFDTIYQLHKFDAILEGIKGDLLFVTPLIEDKDEQEFANEEVAEGIDILDFKPYLRPMLSMTREELFEVQDIIGKGVEIRESFISILDSSISAFSYFELQAVFNYFNAHHLDYRGWIPKGIAMPAPEGMYIFDKVNLDFNISGDAPHLQIPCPTHQMAMAWLREVHNIFIVIEPYAYDYINEKNSSYVITLWQGDNYYENITSKDCPTYEEAVEVALKYSLENLI